MNGLCPIEPCPIEHHPESVTSLMLFISETNHMLNVKFFVRLMSYQELSFGIKFDPKIEDRKIGIFWDSFSCIVFVR